MIYIGIILLIIGIGIRLISIKQLKSSFSLELKMPQHIVTSGIYKYIRHPSYTGSLLIIVGSSMIHTIIGISLISLAFFLSRIVAEETVLRQSQDYVGYARETGMLIPKIKRIKDATTGNTRT